MSEASYKEYPFAFHEVLFPLPNAQDIMTGLDVAQVRWQAHLSGEAPGRESMVGAGLALGDT